MPSEHIEFGEHDPKVRSEQIENLLRELGVGLQTVTPKGYGFILLMATLGQGGGCFYIASVNREDAIKMLEEMTEKLK